jgi:hypothetical protein
MQIIWLLFVFFGGGGVAVNGTMSSDILRKWPTLKFTQAGILEAA